MQILKRQPCLETWLVQVSLGQHAVGVLWWTLVRAEWPAQESFVPRPL